MKKLTLLFETTIKSKPTVEIVKNIVRGNIVEENTLKREVNMFTTSLTKASEKYKAIVEEISEKMKAEIDICFTYAKHYYNNKFHINYPLVDQVIKNLKSLVNELKEYSTFYPIDSVLIEVILYLIRRDRADKPSLTKKGITNPYGDRNNPDLWDCIFSEAGIEIFLILLGAIKNINYCDNITKQTFLHLFVQAFDFDNDKYEKGKFIIQALRNNYADFNLQDAELLTPLALALRTANPKLVEEIIKSGANVNNKLGRGDQSELMVAIESGCDFKVIKTLIEYGAHINYSDASGNTPLSLALNSQNIPLMMLLLDREVNTRTLLHYDDEQIEACYLIELYCEYLYQSNYRDDANKLLKCLSENPSAQASIKEMRTRSRRGI